MTQVLTNENKEIIKRYEELRSKIRDLIRSITNNSDDYDEKYIKIKFNSNDELPLNKTTVIPSLIIVVRAVFHKNKKYYPQVFLDECLRRGNKITDEETKTDTTKFNEKKCNLSNKKFLCFACLFINYNCIIDSC